MHRTRPSAVGVRAHLQRGSEAAEAGDGMTAARIPDEAVGQIAEADPGRGRERGRRVRIQSWPMTRVLVTGGVRSGKSAYAEALFAGASSVTYIAAGPTPEDGADPEWAARIAAHRDRRPAHWATVEHGDVAAVLRATQTPVLVDCLGTWLTATVDALGTWDQPLATWQDRIDEQVRALVEAWQDRTELSVAVTNEVGWGLVSEHRSGRVFADLLGRVNQAVAAVSDEVVLLVAGRPLRL